MHTIERSKNALEKICKRVLDACKKEIEVELDGKTHKIDLLVPSGDMKYPCFWVRDAAMMASSGLIPAEDIKTWLYLISTVGQNGEREMILDNDLIVPPWSIADHITFGGEPIYFPGTITPGKNQGNGEYGYYPPHDDQYYFIEMAYIYYKSTLDLSFLQMSINGLTLIERLENAFISYNIDSDTGLCMSSFPRYTVDWGFCDSIIKSGALLFPSLLRYRAAIHLQEIYSAIGFHDKATEYKGTATSIRNAIIDTFCQNDGWFISATDIGKQRDVWGTAFAIWVGILSEQEKKKACLALLKAYNDGLAINKGYVRHILIGDDASENSAWQMSRTRSNYYQNGGYWATPLGWYLYALWFVDKQSVEEILKSFINHTDKMEGCGAPFEWRTTDDEEYSGKLYGTSAALPYAGLIRVLKEL